MVNKAPQRAANSWTTRRDEKRRRIESVRSWMQGPILSQEKIVDALELLVKSGDRVVLEGDNQKQADFLSRSLVKVDPKKLQDPSLRLTFTARAGEESCTWCSWTTRAASGWAQRTSGTL
jgi:malonate decarboxylase alpha subunit